MSSSNSDTKENETIDIDFRKIFQFLAKNKNAIFRNLAIAICIWFIFFISYVFVFNKSTVIYSLILGLNFPQASQGKYPNGSQLSASDLISNTVLENVWKQNNLDKKGISFENFQKMFSAVPYLGEVNFIDSKFKSMLSQKNLSRTDIEKIESDYRNEIQAAASRSIKLTLDERNSGIDTLTATKLLDDVVNTWNKIAIEKLGVSRSPKLDGIELNDDMKKASPYILVNYLNDLIFKINTTLSFMRQEPNINVYRDPKSNLNLSGITARIEDISKYQVDELDAFVAINTKPSDWEMLQTQYRLKELYSNKIALEKKAEVYRKALLDYSSTTSQTNLSNSGEMRNKLSNSNDVLGVQIGSDAISKIFSLATESKDSNYRQEITTQRINLENQANDLNVHIQKIERRISTASKTSKFSESSKKEYIDLVDKTWNNLAATIDVIQRIQSIAQKDFVGDNGTLYTIISKPKPINLNSEKIKIYALSSLILFLLISFFITLIRIYFTSNRVSI